MTAAPVKVLLVENHPATLERARQHLAAGAAPPFTIVHADSAAAAKANLEAEPFDAVVLDLELSDASGTDTVTQLRGPAGDLPVVVVTTADAENASTEAIRRGAAECLTRADIASGALPGSILRAIARRDLQQALAARTQKLEAANQVKSLFVDIIRHDLLDQVTAIVGAADLLLAHETDGECAELLRTVIRRAERLADIVSAASLFAKLEGPEELPRERLDLNALVRAAATDVRPLVTEKQQRLTVRSEPESYALVNPVLQNAVVNLLRNAVRYSPPGRRIDVKLTATEDGYRIAVTDWGDGIPAAERENLLRRLHQPATGAASGRGLGLAIVERIVDLHGGVLRLGDNPEGGSIFTIDLPPA